MTSTPARRDAPRETPPRERAWTTDVRCEARPIEKKELKSIPGYDWANSQEPILLKFAKRK
jgi:hypothetical protein